MHIDATQQEQHQWEHLRRERNCAHHGFSTIEILIAFGVGIMFLSASIMIAYSDIGLTQGYVLDNGQAITLDALLDSTALATSTNKLSAVIASLSARWYDTVSGSSDDTYTNTLHILDISPCTKLVRNETTWHAQYGRTRAVQFETAIGNIEVARTLGQHVCDPLPPSSWTRPENPHWETAAGAIKGSPTGMAYAVIHNTPYIFVTTSHTTNEHDLWVVDVSENEHPEVVASYETGGGIYTRGLLDIAVVTTSAGTYAYLLQNSTTSQLLTLNLEDPLSVASPTHTISFDTFGVNPNGSNPEGRVITYYDEKIYVGLRTTIGPELLVFETTTDPARPQFVGSVANSFDHSVYAIAVQGDYAYLGIKPGSPPSGNGTRELIVMDVAHTPPRDTGGGYNATSSTNDTEGAMSLYLIGNTLYMGRERVSNVAEKDFYAFDVSSSTRPVVTKSKRLGLSTGGGLGAPRVTDLVVQGGIGFVATTDSTRSFQIYDVVNDAGSIEPITHSCTQYLTLPRLTKIIYKNNIVYALYGVEPTLGVLRDMGALCTP